MKMINLFILLILFGGNTIAQNIYNLENTLEYAQNLYSSHEYELAAQEYERVIFLDSTNTEAKLQLIRSLRKSEQSQTAIKRMKSFYPDAKILPAEFSNEYCKLLIKNKQYETCRNFINQNINLPERDKQFYLAVTNMFETKWENADKYLSVDPVNPNSSFKNLAALNNEALNTTYKKPWVSAGLSTLIPGLGKVYSGYWKDGLLSLLFVGLSGWQAYRGFDQHGTNSAYGWIYGGVSLGFYLGNIFGSVKSANKYNFNKNQKIIGKVQNIYSGY